MPSSSRVATTSAGAMSQNRSECNTARTVWRSAADSARGGRARDGLAVDTGGRRRRYSVVREISSAWQAWVAEGCAKSDVACELPVRADRGSVG
jgi:hypothetical protein